MKCVNFQTVNGATDRQATTPSQMIPTAMDDTVRAVPSNLVCARPSKNPATAVASTNVSAGSTNIFQ